MPYEKGGRADKLGNKYEIDCIVYEVLKVINEENYSIVIEPIGLDEKGTDILITNCNGEKIHQQCKGRNGSEEFWKISDMKGRGIFKAWKTQLNRDDERKVALISPIGCTFLKDLIFRAKNTNGIIDDFYNIQIKESSDKFQSFYDKLCSELDLDIKKEKDINKSISFLRRIEFNQVSEDIIQQLINQEIKILFSDEIDKVYSVLVEYVVMKLEYGGEITQIKLRNYIRNKRLNFRLKEGDRRVLPRIIELNNEYRSCFRTFKNGLEYRKEFDDCIQALKESEGVIIYGGAGCGKSGCTEAILDYCEDQDIPHVAIKLDRRIPSRSCEMWSQDLGLPYSIVHCIHNISKNENAVIILDQLDALRWTQYNSKEAIDVCKELISEIGNFNKKRAKKIVPVFVCRIYDLENDKNISMLFNKSDIDDNSKENKWKRIKIGHIEEEIKDIVGTEYDHLSKKLKELLKTPANLYIWQHLNIEKKYSECSTTSHLIKKWFEQICNESVHSGLSHTSVNDAKQSIVDKLEKSGRLYVLRASLSNIDNMTLEYLVSSDLIVIQNNKVSFVHQIILDYFISEKMLEKYFEDENVEDIIGNKKKQTPSKRYQIQMALQNLLEADKYEFIEFGKKLLDSPDIRYYVKYVFYEILGQIEDPDEVIMSYVMKECENKIDNNLIENVIYGKQIYISEMIKNRVLERWYADPKKRTGVYDLLQSVAYELEDEGVEFIKKYAFENRNDDCQFIRCFKYDISRECDRMFELRLEFYKRYPEYANNVYIDEEKINEKYQMRIIEYISFLLRNKIEYKDDFVYPSERIDISESSIKIIFDELLQCIPKLNDWELRYSNWAGSEFKNNIERTCMCFIEKATISLCKNNPGKFWEIYNPYMGKNYYLFDELILKGFVNLSTEYSNDIVKYLGEDLNGRIFDYTSGADNQLKLAKAVLRKHGQFCDNEAFDTIENAIYSYVPSDAFERYNRRVKQNKSKGNIPVYWSFWGDLQYELIPCLPKERIKDETKELLSLLDRRFKNIESYYSRVQGHVGRIKSPIHGKKLTEKQWLQIINSQKLKDRNESKWVECEDGYIDHSGRMFAIEFENKVVKNPAEMLKLMLLDVKNTHSIFIDALFNGVLLSEKLNEIDNSILEKMFQKFPCEVSSQRSLSFCGIIEKVKKTEWSPSVIKQLNTIALQCNYDIEEIENEKNYEAKSLNIKAYNCHAGSAMRAIGYLISKNKMYLNIFKDVIEKMIQKDSFIEKFTSLYALYPSYFLDKDWASEIILALFESDVQMVIYPNSQKLLFDMHTEYRERVNNIVSRSFQSEDEQIKKIGGYLVCELYIRYDEFSKVIYSTNSKSKDQIQAILEMAIAYLNSEEHREIAKKIILYFAEKYDDLEWPLTKMFYNKAIDLVRDKLFIHLFMKTNAGKRTIADFVRYLERSEVSIIDYAEIVIELCEDLLSIPEQDLKKCYNAEYEISKLIVSLYDETADSKVGELKELSYRCMDLWDTMFERQLGIIREVSKKLIDR